MTIITIEIDQMASQAMKSVEINNHLILIVKLEDEFFALGGICTHKGCKLSEGTIDGRTIRCPCHHSAFNIKTGEVVKGPAKKPVPSYPVTEETGVLHIDIG